MSNANSTLSLCILSGKGGVGKTNLALNLGYALYKAANRVLLMDFDVGLANIDVLLGLSPEKNLQDLLTPGTSPREVLLALEENGFDFLPAASGVPELIDMDEDMKESMFSKLGEVLEAYEYLILDLGAGISHNVLSLAAMTQMRVLLVTPEPTSLTDGYAVIKVLFTQYKISDFFVLVNQAASANEAKTTFERLRGACRKFLDLEIRFLGGIRYDTSVPDAVRHQVPLLKFAPQCKASLDILNLALKLKRYREKNLEIFKNLPVLKKNPLSKA